MLLVNIILTIGLILLISGITVLSLYAVLASSRSEQVNSLNKIPSNHIERRRHNTKNFPLTCSDGTKVYFDRRIRADRRYA